MIYSAQVGALREMSGALPQESIGAALRRLVKHAKWVELDERALTKGRELFREASPAAEEEVCHAG